MTYATVDSYNLSQGAEVLFCYVNDISTGLFIIMFLLSVWLIFTIGSYMLQLKTRGIGDFYQTMTLGSITTLVSAILLRLVDCGRDPLVSNIVLAVCIVVTLISLALLFFSED